MPHPLRLCPACDRHVRIAEHDCPFCGVWLPTVDLAPLPPPGLGRSAQLLWGVLIGSVVTGCATTTDSSKPPATSTREQGPMASAARPSPAAGLDGRRAASVGGASPGVRAAAPCGHLRRSGAADHRSGRRIPGWVCQARASALRGPGHRRRCVATRARLAARRGGPRGFDGTARSRAFRTPCPRSS